jgi:excisionase family DNA binding protein
MNTRLLNVAEAAERLGLKKPTIYKYVCERAIPFVKINAAVRFDPERLDAWVAERAVEPIARG